MNDSYDIIIVGAGPSGTTAALYAAKNGLKTLLLEKDKFPRDKICGDALSGKSIGVLRDLNLLEEVQKLPGAFIQSITFSSPNHDYFNIDLKQTLDNAIKSPFFRDRFANATPEEKPIGWNLPVGSKRRKSYGNGFLLLGDAIGLIDPFTGEGIGNAMYSGKYAIETAVEAIRQNNYSANFLSQYEDNLWAAIGSELKVSTKLQKIGQKKSLLNFVIKKAADNPEVGNLIAGMLANEVPRKELTNPLFYLKLFFSKGETKSGDQNTGIAIMDDIS